MYQVVKTPAGASDVVAAILSSRLVFLLAWQDVRQRYRRSILGPFWITISNAVLIGTIGLVFGQVFGLGAAGFLPSLAVGLTLWTFVSTSILEGCTSFVSAEAMIKQLPIPLFVHVERVIARNLLILLHNAVIIPPVLWMSGTELTGWSLLSVLGLILLTLNMLWAGLFVAILCTRYRDLPQIFANIVQVMFYLTPIIWIPALLSNGHLLLVLNPFYHLIEVVRTPLLGRPPSAANWGVTIALALLGWGLSIAFYTRYRGRIAYWL